MFKEVCNDHSHSWNLGMFHGYPNATTATYALMAWKAQWWTTIAKAFPEEFKRAGYSDINDPTIGGNSSGVEYNSRRVAE